MLDLRFHETVVEHSGGQVERVALTPDRAVAEVTREVLTAVRSVGGAVEIDPAPQEVPWSVPLDEDYEHASYDRAPPAPWARSSFVSGPRGRSRREVGRS